MGKKIIKIGARKSRIVPNQNLDQRRPFRLLTKLKTTLQEAIQSSLMD